MDSRSHFSQLKTYLSQLIDKFLKFGLIECLIHCVWNVSSFVLCKLAFLFSIVKVELGPKFSPVDSKLEFFSVGLGLYFHVFTNLRQDLGVFECYSD